MVPQPQLGPNHHPSAGTFGPAAGCCQKDPGYVWPTGLAKGEGLADAKSPFSQDGVLIQPPLNPLLAGMWWEVSAEAAEMACTIDQFLTSDRSPDSGARRVRNCDPRNLGPDCGSGQGLPQAGLCATFQ